MIKFSLFASQKRSAKLTKLGNAPQVTEQHECVAAVAAEVDCAALAAGHVRGSQPPVPTVLMFRHLMVRHLLNLSDEPVQFQQLGRLSFVHVVGLYASRPIPEGATIGTFNESLIPAGASERLFEAVNRRGPNTVLSGTAG